MSGFDEVVTIFPEATDVPTGLPLVVALTGFSDAGQLVPQLDDAFASSGTVTTIAQFSRDILFDYRARRPAAHFDGTHVASVDMPELELSFIDRGEGESFLYLHGYEPDFRWELVIACIEDLIAEFGVSTVTTFHAIPMPVPHTRPLQSTVSGNREQLGARWSVWKPQTQLPSSILHVLEARLSEDTDDEILFASFILLIPHYLADSELPGALAAALERFTDATGIVISDASIGVRDTVFLAKVTEQVNDNPELASLVEGLERRYDEYMEGVAESHREEVDFTNLPTADEIAAEFETFLAAQTKKDNDSEK